MTASHSSPDATPELPSDALAATLPAVAAAVPRLVLGEWPTPVEPLGLWADLWVKREDLSSPAYGGNKVRCLEPVLGRAAADGVKTLVGTGAWGSNQALALAIHGQRHGFETAALLFPQPPSSAAAANLTSLLATSCAARILPTIAHFPIAWLMARLDGQTIVPPGAAVPRGAIGHVAAAMEVALAVRAGLMPAPRHVVLAVGSTCTTAGLLVGFAAAERLGIGFEWAPTVHAVRVTPWPVTAPWRIARLAGRTAALLESVGGPSGITAAGLRAGLRVHGSELGRGYGHATERGVAAIARFDAAGGPHLDTTYAGKAGAWLAAHGAQLDGPTLFWATKSAVQPPGLSDSPTGRVGRWLERGMCSA